MKNYILLLLLATFGTQAQTLQNPTFGTVKIKNNITSATATKVNVQEANGEVNTQTINTGFNKNIGLGGSDVVGATTLLNQYSTTPVDWTATAFNSGQVVFYGGKQWIAKIATVAGDVPAVSSKWEEITFEALANKTTTVDQTIIDGSTNAVSGNAVFDGLATKFPTPTGLTTNYLPKWNGSGFGNSSIFDNGTNIGIGTTNPTAKLTVKGAYSVGSSIPTDWALLSAGRMGVAKNDRSLYFDIYNGYAEVSTYDWSSWQAYPMVFQGNGGNSMFGTNVDNGVDRVQVAGTISASPATTANQVVVKSQLDAVAASSGTYTPTVSASTNCVSPGALPSTYAKNGNTVTLRLNVLAANFTVANTLTTITVNLPVNRTLTAIKNIGSGSGFNTLGEYWSAIAQTGANNNTVVVSFRTPSTNTGNIILFVQYDITQ